MQQNDNIRLTWQASQRNKLNVSYDCEYRCDCHRDVSATSSPEAARVRLYFPQIFAVTWNFPVTNRLLLEAGTLTSHMPIESDAHDGQSENTVPVTDSLLDLSLPGLDCRLRALLQRAFRIRASRRHSSPVRMR